MGPEPNEARPDRRRPRQRRSSPPAAVQRRRAALGLVLIGLVALTIALTAGHASHGQGHGSASTSGPAGGGAAGPGSADASPGTPGSQTRSGESSEVRRLVALGKPIYCAGSRGNEVALTFDDGPGPYTRLMLAKLRKHGVHATFFVVGRNIALDADATRQERALGAVGDHTFTHPLLTALPTDEAEAEIVRTQQALARSSGGPVFLFRPPYGGRSPSIDAIARAHGMLEVLWTVDSADALGANYAQIERNVIGGLRPGAIVLMHENHGQTVRAMLSIFAALQRKHLHAVSVPQLLSDDPPSLGRVQAGGEGCGSQAGSSLGGG